MAGFGGKIWLDVENMENMYDVAIERCGIPCLHSRSTLYIFNDDTGDVKRDIRTFWKLSKRFGRC